MSETNPFYGKTFAERLAIRQANEAGVDKKVVKADESEVEDKAVKSAESKSPAAKKSAAKKS